MAERDHLSPVFILCALTLVYGVLAYAPYRLEDDNWLLRGFDPVGSYPSLAYMSVVQGRPVFAGLVWLFRELGHLIGGEPAIVALRAFGIAALAAFGWQLQRFVERQGVGRAASLAIAIGAVTLPTFQVYMADGSWLALPLALSGAGVVMITGGRSKLRIAAAIVLFGLALASYQPLAFVAVACAGFALLARPTIDRDGLREALWIVGCLLAALVIYYVLWRLAYRIGIGSAPDGRYSPNSLIHDPLLRAVQFWSLRVPQALRLWDISPVSNRVALLSAGIILAGVGMHTMILNRNAGWRRAVIDTALRLALLAAALMGADTAALAGPVFNPSYTTVVGTSLFAYLAVCWSLLVLARAVTLVPVAPLAALCVLGMVMAQETVIRQFVIPLSTEAANFRAAVRAFVAEHGQAPRRVQIYAEPIDRNPDVVGEYAWRNLNHEFYIHWFVLNQLADLGLDTDAEVVVMNGLDNLHSVYAARRPVPPEPTLTYGAASR